MPIFTGTASFFNNCPTSGPGGGACGTCYSNNGGVAYPHVTGFPTDYSYACAPEPPPNNGGLPALACGYYLPISSCTVSSLLTPIVDHGPGAACTIDQIPSPNCDGQANYCYRILDLTPITFSDLGGDPLQGLVLVAFTTP